MKERIIIKGGFIPTITNPKNKIDEAVKQVQKLTEFDLSKFITVAKPKEN